MPEQTVISKLEMMMIIGFLYPVSKQTSMRRRICKCEKWVAVTLGRDR